jgi:hypothetical protein
MGVKVTKKESKPVDYEAIARARTEEERKKLLERQRRGLSSMIRTSYTGVLSKNDTGSQPKKLLGE